MVASEVKELAQQTSKATDVISEQIHGIQSSVRNAAIEIEAISGKINDIESLTGSVASAIEEQRATNDEIARSATSASDSTGKAVSNMSSVSHAAQQTSAEASSVNTASDLVSEASNSLAQEIEQFLLDVTKDVKDRRRSTRKAFCEDVTLVRSSGSSSKVQFVDISQTGAQISQIQGLKVGETVTLELLNGGRVRGTVARESNVGFGIDFQEALSEELEFLAA